MAFTNEERKGARRLSTTSDESCESVVTEVPPATKKTYRRESWVALDTDQKLRVMYKAMHEIQNEEEALAWFQSDPTTGLGVMNALREYYDEIPADLDRYKEQVQALKEDLQASGLETREAGLQIDQLEEERAGLQRQIRELKRAAASPAPSFTSSSVKKVPDIPIWTGGSPEDFQSWVTSLRMKLRVSADHFATDDHKAAYLFNRLGDEAQKYIESFLDEDMSNSFDELLTFLKRRYADPHRASTAHGEYIALKQMNMDLATFVGKFYQLTAAARIPEHLQVQDFKSKLSDRFHNKIVGQEYDNLSALIRYLERVDSDMKLRDQDKAARLNARRSLINRPTTSVDNSQERSKVGTPVAVKRELNDNSNKRPPPKCYSCQEMGHIARYCPQGKDEPSSKA